MYGLPFTLSDDAKETRDSAWFLRSGMSHQAQISNTMLWRSSANLSLTNYFRANAYDTTTLSFSTGPVFRLSQKASVSIPLNGSVQQYNSQSHWYSQTTSISPRFQYAASQMLQFYIDASIGEKRFRGNNERETDLRSLNLSLNYQPSDGGNIAFGIKYNQERSGLDIFTNDVRSVFLGYEHEFKEAGMTASLTGTITDTAYEGIQAAYNAPREDLSRELKASFSYAVPSMQGATIDGSVSFQDNTSNLDINTYDRTQISVGFTKRF